MGSGVLDGSVDLSVQRLILGQVMISRFMSSSPALGSALTVQRLLEFLSFFLYLSLSLSLKNKQTLK